MYTGNAVNREFVGLQNFVTLFTDEFYKGQCKNALGNKVVFFIIHMLVQNVLGMLLAVLLTNPKMRGRRIYQTIIFIPTTFAVLITGYLWKLMLNPQAGIIAILTFVNNFNAFDIIFSMETANGAPGYATDLIGSLFYRVGIAGQHPTGV